MASSVEQIVNQGLMGARSTRRIATIYEGSEQAKIALELYGQARDELLDAKDWSFSRRTAPLTLLKGPPPNGGYDPLNPWSNLYPAPGFLYEYAYPTDAVDLRAIIPMPGAMPDLDPRPAVWRVDNDPTPIVSGDPPTAAGPEAKVIFCNVTNAMGVYRSRVTNPAVFDPGFTAALVALLAERFAVALGEDISIQREGQLEAVSTAQAESDIRG